MTKNFKEFHRIRSAHKGGDRSTPEEVALEKELSSVKSNAEGKELQATKAAEAKKAANKAAKKTQPASKPQKKSNGVKTAPKDDFSKMSDEDLINLADVAEAQAKASKK